MSKNELGDIAHELAKKVDSGEVQPLSHEESLAASHEMEELLPQAEEALALLSEEFGNNPRPATPQESIRPLNI